MNEADLVKVHYMYYKNPAKYKRFIPKGWNELNEYTDNNSMVFQKGNDIVIAMRGLDPKSPQDLYIGSNIIAGDLLNPRGFDYETSRGKYKDILQREQQKIDVLKKQYPNSNIELAGHSRGGRKAIDLGEFNKLKYHAYNPGDASSLRDKVYSLALPYLMGVIPTNNIAEALGYASTFAMNMGDSGAVPSNFLTKLGFTSPLELAKPITTASVRAGISERPIATTIGSLTEDVLVPAVLDYTMMGIGGRPISKGAIEDSFEQNEKLTQAYLTQDLLEAGIERSTLPEDVDMEQLKYILDPVASQEADTISEYSAKTFETIELSDRPQREYQAKIEDLDVFNEIENVAESIYGKNLNDKSVLERFAEGYRMAAAPLMSTQQLAQGQGNIYVTERDIVSHGYKGSKLQSILGRPEIVEPKNYVNSYDPTHHTIDHFITREMYNKINNNQYEQPLSIPTSNRVFQTEFIGSGAGGQPVNVNVKSLCESNPQLLACKYIN